jgi:hypothetical protein
MRARARVTVAQRAFALSLNALYSVSVKLSIASDGNPMIEFSVDDVVQLTISELSQLYAQGQVGFGLWGSIATNSVQFSAIAYGPS